MTPEDLWLEWLEDMTEKSPDKLDEVLGTPEAEEAVQFVTGDDQFDAVDAAASQGDTAAVERLLDSWGKGPAPEDGFEDAY